ncbi:MAG: hypothetical protein HPAVJP_4330 [Candidatus Hepatoplasma vulgare]|nr:MAG: hypothetical protein HPAVJP_4330 [Candidatus Hepatoplasma sp.]
MINLEKVKYKKVLLCILFFGLFLLFIPLMINVNHNIEDLKEKLSNMNSSYSNWDIYSTELKNSKIILAALIFIDIFLFLSSLKYVFNLIFNINLQDKEFIAKNQKEENINNLE